MESMQGGRGNEDNSVVRDLNPQMILKFSGCWQ